LLAELEDAEAEASEVGNVPRGPLRIQVPRGFGRTVVVPSLVEFLARYPEVAVDISVNDGAIDPAEEEVDASAELSVDIVCSAELANLVPNRAETRHEMKLKGFDIARTIVTLGRLK
jgi:hypothetical protein